MKLDEIAETTLSRLLAYGLLLSLLLLGIARSGLLPYLLP